MRRIPLGDQSPFQLCDSRKLVPENIKLKNREVKLPMLFLLQNQLPQMNMGGFGFVDALNRDSQVADLVN